MMLHKLTDRLSGDPRDPVGLLFIAGLIRDDMPWLAEVVLESYRQVRRGDRKALSRLRRTIAILRKSVFIEELGMESKEAHMLLRELPELVDRFTRHLEERLLDEQSEEVSGESES